MTDKKKTLKPLRSLLGTYALGLTDDDLTQIVNTSGRIIAKQRGMKIEYDIHICNSCSKLRSVFAWELISKCDSCGGEMRVLGDELPMD